MSSSFTKHRWGDLLRVHKSKLVMDDTTAYPLASIRRRNGGFFSRETKLGRDILTKTLAETVVGAFVISRMQIVHGACASAPETMRGTFLSASYTQFLPKEPARIDMRFLHYLGHLDSMYKSFMRSSHGVHIEKMTFDLNDWMRQQISLPPLPEQKKIASILTSVDEVIDNTQKQIDKLQDLKKATMNELLTKGIGHTEFKDSELGRIPKIWEVELLDEVTDRGSGHTPSKKHPNYWDGGVKWVSLADSYRLDKGLIHESDNEISDDGLANSSAVLHPAGTVILSRDAGIGKSAILGTDMAVSQHFIAWRCGAYVDSWYLYYWMQRAKPEFEAIAMGSTIKTIGLAYFKKLKLAVPPLAEQKSIAEALNSIDNQRVSALAKLSKFKSIKKALMQDLLTGKVRVSVN